VQSEQHHIDKQLSDVIFLFRLLFPTIFKKVQLYDKYNQIITSLIENNDKNIAINRTHKNFEILVYCRVDYNFNLRKSSFINMDIYDINYHHYIISDLKLTAEFRVDKTVFIHDIRNLSNSRKFGCGYGQFAVKKLIQMSKDAGFDEILGELVQEDLCDSNDIQHGKRLLYFYEKMGFTIVLDNTGSTGRIKLEL
jgi:hypothetical protein